VRVCSCINPSVEFNVFAYILLHLTDNIPSSRLNTHSWNHISGLSLADPKYAILAQVDLVLGADVIGYLLQPSMRYGPIGQPVAQDTLLDWIIFGPTGNLKTDEQHSAPMFHISQDKSEQDLNNLIHRFWMQEEIPPPKSGILTADEEQCEQHFRSTHSRTDSGRYVVRLSFRTSHAELGFSYSA
jgi:hypothetical protein